MGHIGMCRSKGYGFSGVLVINWVSILAILIIKRELSVRQVKEGINLLIVINEVLKIADCGNK